MAKQDLSREWWRVCRPHFDIHISEAVIEEIMDGDPEASKRRMEVIVGLPLLEPTDAVTDLFERLLSDRGLPTKAAADALHIAIAVVHGMDFLLTWNCKHINNASLRKRIAAIVAHAGYTEVIMATPEELWREGHAGHRRSH